MKKLFVGNIPHSTTEAELRALFEPHGAIEQVSIVTDRDTGRSRSDVEHPARARGGEVADQLQAPAAVLAERQQLGQEVITRRQGLEEVGRKRVLGAGRLRSRH